MARTRGRQARGGQEVLSSGRNRVLVVLFVPSVERDGTSPIDQPRWVDSALDERGGALVKDEPVVVHCYTTPADIQDDRNLAELGSFCRKMGREARQGEIGLVVGDE
jgi:hypothetical protein